MKQKITAIGTVLLSLALLSGCGNVSFAASAAPSRAAASPGSAVCPHVSWENGVCAQCGLACGHETWKDGVCTRCSLPCPHETHDRSGVCPECGSMVSHSYEDGICTVCSAPEYHTYRDGVCTDCGLSLDELFSEGFDDDGYLLPEYTEPVSPAGTVETLEYTTHYYAIGSENPIRKKMQVYLPADYDPDERYNVLVLLHGLYQTEESWFGTAMPYYADDSRVSARVLLDNLYARGETDHVIVAAVTYFRNSADQTEFSYSSDYMNFPMELRQDILPLLAEHYSTYAVSSSQEDIAAARDHFGIAGLSLGAMIIYGGVLMYAPDLFGWYGCFSGCDGDYEAIAASVDEKASLGYPIRMFYNSIGTLDPWHGMHREGYTRVTAAESLTDGENAVFFEVPNAEHSFHAWYTSLVHVMRLFFR